MTQSNPNPNAVGCPACGYLLVGLKAGDKCPECGIPLSPAIIAGTFSQQVANLRAHSNLIGLFTLTLTILPVTSLWRTHPLSLPLIAISAPLGTVFLSWIAARRFSGRLLRRHTILGVGLLGFSIGAGVGMLVAFEGYRTRFTSPLGWSQIAGPLRAIALAQLALGATLGLLFAGYAWFRVPRKAWPA